MSTLAVLWGRFGPYHLARLRGLAEVAGTRGFSVLGVEVAQLDHYRWNPVQSENGVARETLFPGRAYDSLRPGEIRRKVFAALDRIQPMVVAVNGWAMPEARAALAWVRRTPNARAVIMSETKVDEAPRVFWKEWVKRGIVSGAQAGLVGGQRQLEYLAQLGVPRERIRLGYNAVDNAHFEQGSAHARIHARELRQNLHLPERYFFACTRFLPRKNLDGLLRAYARYRNEVGASERWQLVISGSGECEADLHGQVRVLGLAGEVHFVGFRQYEELPAFYGLASAFVHPALSEPWGLVVNEAAASALPLLVSRTVGSAYELVEHGVNGYTFEPGDVDAMTRVLVDITRLPEEARSAMGNAARERVAEFGPERFGQGLCEAMDAARGVRR